MFITTALAGQNKPTSLILAGRTTRRENSAPPNGSLLFGLLVPYFGIRRLGSGLACPVGAVGLSPQPKPPQRPSSTSTAARRRTQWTYRRGHRSFVDMAFSFGAVAG